MTFGYGPEVVLDRVSLEIGERDFLAVIGPNGGGKTTLLKVLLGLLEPRSGSVGWSFDRRAGAVGYVPQFAGFDRSFPISVFEAVRTGRLGGRGLLRSYAREDELAVGRWLERLGLAALARVPLADLSGGQLQRTLIARALVADPRILLLDEPMGSIDSESREVVLSLLAELNRRAPVVVVTHDVTLFGGLMKQVACVNRRLHYHPRGEVTAEMLEQVYGCPVELVTHGGVPHRVLGEHRHPGGGPGGGGPAPP